MPTPNWFPPSDQRLQHVVVAALASLGIRLDQGAEIRGRTAPTTCDEFGGTRSTLVEHHLVERACH
jgi:hypothetical protein